MEYICIGKIVNTFGLRGELKIESYSDFDALRYQPGSTVYVFFASSYQPQRVATFRQHKGYSLVSFVDRQDINAVQQYQNCPVFIEAQAQQPLPDGQFYMHQLIGLRVQDEAGNLIGRVTAIQETGAQNNLRVCRPDGTDCLIPNVPAFVRQVDLQQQVLTVHVIEGLL